MCVCGRVDTGGNRQVMDHLKDTGMLEEVSRGNDQLGKERRKGKVFQVNPQSPMCCAVLCCAYQALHVLLVNSSFVS